MTAFRVVLLMVLMYRSERHVAGVLAAPTIVYRYVCTLSPCSCSFFTSFAARESLDYLFHLSWPPRSMLSSVSLRRQTVDVGLSGPWNFVRRYLNHVWTEIRCLLSSSKETLISSQSDIIRASLLFFFHPLHCVLVDKWHPDVVSWLPVRSVRLPFGSCFRAHLKPHQLQRP